MPTQKTPSRAIRGEPWVWFTALGLSLGLFMVVALLGLILFRGLEVFWPKPIVQLTINSGTNSPEKLLGEIVSTKILSHKPHESQEEWQIYTGNREAFSLPFRHVKTQEILQQGYPKDVIVLERLEYGDAIGFPRSLKKTDGSLLNHDSAEFLPVLTTQIDITKENWDKIQDLEKKQIGKINRALEKISLQEKRLEGQVASEAREKQLSALKEQRASLQTSFETLAQQARELRSSQNQYELNLELSDGQIRPISLGQIVHYSFPNTLNLQKRLSLFFQNIGRFLIEDPREANTEGGIFPALFGTLVMTILMSLAVVPFGVLGAVYLKEYAKPGPVVRWVRVAVHNLAGVPSIVFGVFGLGFFVYMVGGSLDRLFFSDSLPTPTFGTGGIFWASLTLALMTVPVVIVSTEEALGAVGRGVREGALALGASQWQTVKKILPPASGPGILTGAILAMARGAGEVAPLMLVGVVKLAPALPLDGNFPYLHLDQKFMHLGFHIFDLAFQSPDSEAAKPMVFATTLLLIVLILLLNLGAMVLRERLRKKYATGTF